MLDTTLFNYHSHDRILIRLSALFVHPNNLVYTDVADQVAMTRTKSLVTNPRV